MSGGHFNYQQFVINDIADEISRLIDENDIYSDSYSFSTKTLENFKEAVSALQRAAVYAHRIDYLVSGDDSEETYHKRLAKELKGLEYEGTVSNKGNSQR